jgi:dihydroneopterin aldolase
VSDTIAITGLRIRGNHGVFEHERRDGQDFVVDVRLRVPHAVAVAGASDRVEDTVDYSVVVQAITAVVAGEAVDLIETLAARIADACLADVRVESVEVTVHKPQAPVAAHFDDIAVTIERARAAGGA